MTYYDVYHCNGCPVSKWCGTAVSCLKLCNSYPTTSEEDKDNTDFHYD